MVGCALEGIRAKHESQDRLAFEVVLCNRVPEHPVPLPVLGVCLQTDVMDDRNGGVTALRPPKGTRLSALRSRRELVAACRQITCKGAADAPYALRVLLRHPGRWHERIYEMPHVERHGDIRPVVGLKLRVIRARQPELRVYTRHRHHLIAVVIVSAAVIVIFAIVRLRAARLLRLVGEVGFPHGLE